MTRVWPVCLFILSLRDQPESNPSKNCYLKLHLSSFSPYHNTLAKMMREKMAGAIAARDLPVCASAKSKATFLTIPTELQLKSLGYAMDGDKPAHIDDKGQLQHPLLRAITQASADNPEDTALRRSPHVLYIQDLVKDILLHDSLRISIPYRFIWSFPTYTQQIAGFLRDYDKAHGPHGRHRFHLDVIGQPRDPSRHYYRVSDRKWRHWETAMGVSIEFVAIEDWTDPDLSQRPFSSRQLSRTMQRDLRRAQDRFVSARGRLTTKDLPVKGQR